MVAMRDPTFGRAAPCMDYSQADAAFLRAKSASLLAISVDCCHMSTRIALHIAYDDFR